MPIPAPKNDESRNDFISRCIGDDKMVDEYPDNKQRVAICSVEWTRSLKGK
jgi:hypothetical protein